VKRLAALGCLFLLFFGGCYRDQPPSGSSATSDAPELPARTFTPKEWKELVLKAREPVLVEFGSKQCPPCRQMTPVFNSLAQDFTVYKVDVDDEKSLALAQAYDIRGLPTMLIFKNGRIAATYLGLTREEDLRESLKQAAAK
jgi:thioredoxin